MRLQIREKSIALILLCVLLPLIAVAAGTFVAERQLLKDIVVADLTAQTDESLERIEEFFTEVHRDTSHWREMSVMQDILVVDQYGAIRRELAQLRQQYTYIAEMAALDRQGVVIATATDRSVGVDLSAESAVQTALRGEYHQSAVGESALVDGPGLTLTMPVQAAYNRNSIVGALVVVIDWSRMQAILAKISVNSAPQDVDRILMLREQAGRVLYLTAGAEQIVGSLSGDDPGVGRIGRRLSADGTAYLYSVAVTTGREGFGDPGWIVEAIVSERAAFASINDRTTNLALIGILGCALAVAIGWWAANNVVRPIMSIITAMRELAHGNVEIDIPAINRKDEVGEIAGALKYFQDMARERQKREEELLKAKEAADTANEAKSNFLSVMSHELRTPLNAILGFSEGMREGVLGPVTEARVKQYAEYIEASGRHLLNLINDVLDLAKIEAKRVRLVEDYCDIADIVKAAHRIIAVQADKFGVDLRLDVPSALPTIFADERRLQQILLNLLSNAVKFTPEGGSVILAISVDRDTGIRITVTDTGVGMQPNEIAVALSPFGQVENALSRKREGTGLGLPLTKHLIELHDGKMAITSAPSVGTTVTAWLPPTRVAKGSAVAARLRAQMVARA